MFAQSGIRVASLSNECTSKGRKERRKTEPKADRIVDNGSLERERGFLG